MDVVNLHDMKEGPENQENKICVITDEVIKGIKCDSNGNFAVYVVFRRNMKITPFMLLYISKERDVTRLDASFVRKHALPMWTEQGDDDAPLHDRLVNEVIKLDFYGSTSGIVYTWTDIYENETGKPAPAARVRCLSNITNESRMNLHVFLPACASTVCVLSERAYGSFMGLNMMDTPVSLKCHIDYSAGSEESWTMYECGHALCQKCYKNIKKTDPPQCVMFCKLRTNNMLRLKLRNGPCPIDNCRKGSQGGVVLIPCGCFIQCEKLTLAYKRNEANLEPLIRNIQICPYDMCNTRISGLKLARD